VNAWAFEGDCDPGKLTSNLCAVEWPPRSGRMIEIPEVDRGAWFALPAARTAMQKSQLPFLDALAKSLQA
jgi:predicted NUDIX family NTP pyrophosphohydrolase